MRRLLLPAFLLVVLAALGAVFLLPGGEDSPGDVTPPHGVPAAPAGESPVPRAFAGPEEELAEGGEVDPSREAVTNEAAAAEPGVPVELTVADARTGEAIPGAVVRWLEWSEYRAEHRRDGVPWPGDWERATTRFGAAFSTDDAGRVMLPRTARGGSGLAICRLGDRWGAVRVWSRETHARLLLDVDMGFVVRTVDGRGRPVGGVPLLLREGRPPFRGDGSSDWIRARGVSDVAAGTWTVPHLQEHVRRSLARDELHVVVDSIFAAPVAVAVDREAVARGSLEVVVPPHGTVRVELRDEGARRAGPIAPHVQLVGPDGSRRSMERGDSVDGVIDFRPIGLGLEVEAIARWDGLTEPRRKKGPGPGRAEETVPLRLGPVAGQTTVHGRLLDATEHPLVDARVLLSFRLRGADGKTTGATVVLSTDGDGAFAAYLDPARVVLPVEGQLDVTPQRLVSGAHAHASIPFAWGEEGERIDVGDVALVMPPRFVAGLVLDEARRPVADARLLLEGGRDQGYGQVFWSPVHGLSGLDRTASDGTFEVRADVTGERFRASAEAPGLAAAAPTYFSPGARGVVLQVEATGAVAGSVVLDEGLPVHAVHPMLRHAFEGGRYTRARPVELARDGSFVVRELRPGPLEFYVYTLGRGTMTPDLGAARAEGGVLTHPRALQEIDLRDLLRCLELEVVDDATGERLADVRASFAQRRPDGGVRNFTAVRPDARGLYVLLTEPHPVDATVWAPGYRLLEALDVADDEVLRLEPGIEVRVRLGAGVPLPEPPAVLEVTLSLVERAGTAAPAGAPLPSLEGLGAVLGETREATVVVPAAGTWSLSARVLVPAGKGRAGERVLLTPESSTLALLPGRRAAEAVVQPTPAGLEALLRER